MCSFNYSHLMSYILYFLLCFSLGDIEKKHKLDVSPLCNRETNTVGNIQIGL